MPISLGIYIIPRVKDYINPQKRLKPVLVAGLFILLVGVGYLHSTSNEDTKPAKKSKRHKYEKVKNAPVQMDPKLAEAVKKVNEIAVQKQSEIVSDEIKNNTDELGSKTEVRPEPINRVQNDEPLQDDLQNPDMDHQNMTSNHKNSEDLNLNRQNLDSKNPENQTLTQLDGQKSAGPNSINMLELLSRDPEQFEKLIV